MFRVVETIEDLAADPIGAALVGDSFITWCATSRLVGTLHVGRREAKDAASLARLYALADHPALRRPLRRVVDGRELMDIDADAWAQMRGVVERAAGSLATLFERQAVIVRPDLDGARTVALLPAFGPTDQFRVFTSEDEAYRWADPEHGADALVNLRAVLATARTAMTTTARSRAWIARNLRGARIESCARALGLSARSLQRELAEAGTTFRALVAEQRVAVARKRLRDETTKIDTIAREVGCSSASQLGVLLRRAGLPSPSEIRAEAARPSRSR